MATSHAFPTRTPYSASLSKMPDRTGTAANPTTSFGASTSAQQREAQRQEREREAQNALNELTEEQREEINEAFGLFDLDKDRLLSYHELKVALKALGFDLSKSEIISILATHGVSPPNARSNAPSTATSTSGPSPASRNLLSLEAFQRLTAQRILARDPREEILRAFALFDEGGKGKIELADLRRVARELGEGLEEEELIAMIEEFDLDGDGGINRDEFVSICLQ